MQHHSAFLFFVLLSSAASVSTTAWGQEIRSALSSLDTTGNPKELALAGATTAAHGSGSLISANPAVAALSPASLSSALGGQSSDSTRSTQRETQNSAFLAGTVPIPTGLGHFGTGVAVLNRSTTFTQAATSGAALTYTNRNLEVRPTFALKVFDEVAFGFGPAYSFTSESIAQTNPSQKIEVQDSLGLAWRMGIAGEWNRLRAGLEWQSEMNLETTKSVVPRNGSALGMPYRPERVSLGGAYSFGRAWLGEERKTPFVFEPTLYAQIDCHTMPGLAAADRLVLPEAQVRHPTYALYVPLTTEETGPAPADLSHVTQWTPRIGLLTRLIDTRPFQVNLLTGSLLAPALRNRDKPKLRATGGLNLNLYGVVVDVALDPWAPREKVIAGLGYAW